MLDDSSQTVSVGGNDYVLALLHLGDDGVVPVRQGALDGQLERLEHGELLGLGVALVAVVLDNGIVVGMVGLHGWWGHIEATAPDLHLSLSVLGSGLSLVQTGQTSVVTLVQAPGLLDGDSGLAALLQDGGQSVLGTGQQGRVGDIELETGFLDGLTGGLGLSAALK